MYQHGAEQSKDDHKYSDVFAMLLDQVRWNVRNVAEIGATTTQSTKVWHDYFTEAAIHRLDIFYSLDESRKFEMMKPQHELPRFQEISPFHRTHFYKVDFWDNSSEVSLGFEHGSMDVVIDDGDHQLSSKERTLDVMWPLLRPGGLYIMEDVESQGDGQYDILHRPEKLQSSTLSILQNNDAFFVDSTLGHRAWELWQQRTGEYLTKDRLTHNSHLVVIRKRVEPLRPVQVNFPDRSSGFEVACRNSSRLLGMRPGLPEPSLEELMYRYGTDQSKDDHKYTDVFAMLFDHIRWDVRNVTEIGVAFGRGLKAWHDYFTSATIHGLDIFEEGARWVMQVQQKLSCFRRAHIYMADSANEASVARLGLELGSMDVIIDDGDHQLGTQQRTLEVMWPLLRPGGLYVIEDVESQGSGQYDILHRPEKLRSSTLSILQDNDAFFVDSTLGHRAWGLWQQRTATYMAELAKDRFTHNSHMVVIRKRIEPLRPIHVNYGERM